MLNLPQIEIVIKEIAAEYKVKNVSVFGSYADGSATEESNLDLLVEFLTPEVSLFTIIGLKFGIEDRLNTKVDVVHAPLDKDTLIIPKSVVKVYGQ